MLFPLFRNGENNTASDDRYDYDKDIIKVYSTKMFCWYMGLYK